MKRMVAYVLSFALILLLIAGCGKNRPKRPPVLVENELDIIFDPKVNDSDDIVDLIKPAKGKASEFEVEPMMMDQNWRWTDKKYFKRNPSWPQVANDPVAEKALLDAQTSYEAALQVHLSILRKDDMEAIGKYYLAFANERRERSQQSLNNWKMYLRRLGKNGIALRKKLEMSEYEMATTCDVNVPGQIIAFWKTPEKTDNHLTISVGKDPNVPAAVAGLKPEKIPEFVESQTMFNFSAAYLEYAKDVGARNATPSIEGLRDHIKQRSYPAFAAMIDEKSIKFVDFTQPKMQYVAVLEKYVNKQGTAVLLKSGSIGRVKDNILAKLIAP